MSQQYLGIERYIFADVYNFFLKYKDTMPNDDIQWEKCTIDAQKLRDKYKGHPLACNMIMNTLEQLEHKSCNIPAGGFVHEHWEQLLADSHKMGW